MKKLFVLLAVFMTSAVLFSCDVSTSHYFSGDIASVGTMPDFFTIENDNIETGFMITDETEIIFTDEMLASIKYHAGEKLSDYLGLYMNVSVVAGDKTAGTDNYISDNVTEWYFAKSITVNSIDEEYFLTDYEQ